MKELKRYVGIDNDLHGGMTDTGKIIRDAWAFGLIPETETCEGWLAQGIEGLWVKVNAEWEKYGFRVGGMPPEMQERYLRIQTEAMERAKAAGWSGAQELMGDV
ncbi:hypothetical protein [Maritimibacter sp. HL-12]|uniref:hypothetical protein n=1 Tax=Maritimibacter sp. HL-12 TaxID=1162418 RepID=UPI000A0F294E|nr:hypothetical protein [Maritimibacter sp. HL-12]SMH50692.1 hypothetical protein SAMN05661107_2345 [Maritimibacter sp. HL-12]